MKDGPVDDAWLPPVAWREALPARVATALGLNERSAMNAHCVAIMDSRYDASRSTAQPPINCTHSLVQWATKRREHVCCACGVTR